MAIFSQKYSDIFHVSAQNIGCGYSLEPPRRGGSNEYPQSMFLSRNNKNNVYPWKPQFYYIKVGFKGSKLYRYVFVMSYRKSVLVLFYIPQSRLWRVQTQTGYQRTLSLIRIYTVCTELHGNPPSVKIPSLPLPVCEQSEDDKLMIFFFLIFPETGFCISRQFSPQERICIKCQSLFSGKNRKKYFKMISGEIFTQSAKR